MFFFDEHHNRRHLLTILLGSESEKSISEGITSLLSWAQRNGKTFPRVKCVLTDLASPFINAFTKTFISILGTNGVDWKWCIWHFKRAVRDKINHFQFNDGVGSILFKKINFILYSRTQLDFDHEIQNLNNYIQEILVSLKINNSEKLIFRKFWDYFAQKLKHKQRWAYCFHDGIPLGTNMSLERFHGEIKSRFPKNGYVPPNHFIWILFQIWEFKKQKCINFAFNPKKENMSFRMNKISIQKELAKQSGRFEIDNNIILLGRLYQIT